MNGKIQRRAWAERDLIAIYQRDAREAGIRVADRYLDVAESTFRWLAKRPGTGVRLELDHPALAELRVAPLSARFKVYLDFYRLHQLLQRLQLDFQRLHQLLQRLYLDF